MVVRRNGISVQELYDTLPFTSKLIDTVILELSRSKLLQLSKGNTKPMPKAWDILEPYRVKRAVILAAGKGSRMLPETTTTPKPMVYVGKKRIVETQLDALLAAGITDITIVRGYRGEVFDELIEKYPNLQFVDNTIRLDTPGVIVSVFLAKQKLTNSYLIEGDLYINNPDVIRPYEYHSSFCGIRGHVNDDWYYVAKKNGTISKLALGTRENDYLFVGIMYWTPEAAARLGIEIDCVMQNFDKHKGDAETVLYEKTFKSIDVYSRAINPNDVVEIDTYEELQSLRASEGEL